MVNDRVPALRGAGHGVCQMKSHLRRFACRCASAFQPPENGAVICAGMVRNEIDIIDSWIAHLNALFDQVIIYDHLSTDGTRERLHALAAQLPKLDVREFDEPGHAQARLMNATLREVAARQDRGWMFFLDADEFIMTHSRREFLAVLERYRAATTIRLTWCNALPETGDGAPRIGAGTRLSGWYVGPHLMPKIAVNLRYAAHVASISQGNHCAETPTRNRFCKVNALRLLHLPIRSRDQISAKVAHGLAANALIDRAGDCATHWKAMAGETGTDDLRRLAYNYGFTEGAQPRPLDRTPPPETISGPLSDHVPMEN